MMSDKTEKVRSLFRFLIAAKILALCVFLFIVNDGVHFGDYPLFARDVPNQSAHADKGSDASDSKEDAGKSRPSFLSNLLELPVLNKESLQKDEVGRYLEIAERKKRQLDERLDLLKTRESQLKKLETSIEDKLRQLDDERRFFAQTIQQEKDLKGERIEKLVGLYAKMEPKKAAPVFEKLDKDLVVELFKQLPPKQVTAILETMTPDRSIFLSEYYGRVRSAREYDLLKEMNQSLLKEFDECKGMPAVAAAE